MTTYDVNSTCHILWVPRAAVLNIAALHGDTSTQAGNIVGSRSATGDRVRWLASDYGSDVLHCTFHKDVDSAVGVFSFTVKPRPDQPYNTFRPGDLVYIYMNDQGGYALEDRGVGTLVTVGIIDRISTQRGSTGGTDASLVSVTGRDIGVIFQETGTVFDPGAVGIENARWSNSFKNALFTDHKSISPLENVMTVIRLFYSNVTGSTLAGSQWTLKTPGLVTPIAALIDCTAFVQTPILGYTRPETHPASESGNVWALLMGHVNPAVNEFFFDVRDYVDEEINTVSHLSKVANNLLQLKSDYELQVQARDQLTDALNSKKVQPARVKGRPILSMVFRQRPYDSDTFALLPTHTVDESEVFDGNIGYSFHDVFNFFSVRFTEVSGSTQEHTVGIRVNRPSIARYGLRRMDMETKYKFTTSQLGTDYYEGKKGGTFDDVFKFYYGLLSTWYAANDLMGSGSITMRFQPKIRVGTRLRLTKTDSAGVQSAMLFYIHDVQHAFSSEPGGSRTTLSVVRGIPEGGTGLVNNLLWDGAGRGIPPDLDPYGINETAYDSTVASDAGEVISDNPSGLTQ